MSPLAPLLALLFLAPVPAAEPPPAIAVFANADEVTLVLASNRATPMRIADPRDVDGLGYSLMFIRVRGPDGELVPTPDEDGWWTPRFKAAWPGPNRPEPWAVQPGETVTLRTPTASLIRGMADGPAAGDCQFQVRAIVRDDDRWPWSEEGPEGGVYTVLSTWTAAPCRTLFPPR